MKYIRLGSRDPYVNLAIEEFLLRETKEDVFMLWQNDPTVVIGKNQNAYAEVDLAYAEAHGIRVARRLSGGGAVYHDSGNINYTFITFEGEGKDFSYFTRPIIEALATLGVPIVQNGRNDLECEGRKISGNARYTANGRILHHGTLLFDADVGTISSVLCTDPEKFKHKAVKSHAARVGALAAYLGDGMTATALMDHIERYVLSKTGASVSMPPSDEQISALRARNASREWILSDRRYLTEYTVSRKRKYPFGLVRADLTLWGQRIESIRISGDFFACAPIEDLEEKLVGQSIDAPLAVCPETYIADFTAEMLLSLLAGEETNEKA